MEFSDGIIFEIVLTESNPYLHVILDDPEWSRFSDEKETLFFPYFPFYFERTRNHEGKYDIFTIKQDENCKVFSQDFQEMKNYWNKLIKKLKKSWRRKTMSD